MVIVSLSDRIREVVTVLIERRRKGEIGRHVGYREVGGDRQEGQTEVEKQSRGTRVKEERKERKMEEE